MNTKHTRQCRVSFPGCLCLRCTKDGTLEKPCCFGKPCGEFQECPDFELEEGADEDETE